jgi:hypothetical protein
MRASFGFIVGLDVLWGRKYRVLLPGNITPVFNPVTNLLSSVPNFLGRRGQVITTQIMNWTTVAIVY